MWMQNITNAFQVEPDSFSSRIESLFLTKTCAINNVVSILIENTATKHIFTTSRAIIQFETKFCEMLNATTAISKINCQVNDTNAEAQV